MPTKRDRFYRNWKRKHDAEVRNGEEESSEEAPLEEEGSPEPSKGPEDPSGW